jgi:hypothetical protein
MAFCVSKHPNARLLSLLTFGQAIGDASLYLRVGRQILVYAAGRRVLQHPLGHHAPADYVQWWEGRSALH